jgi:hypothetical protein
MRPSPATDFPRQVGITVLLFAGLTFVLGWLWLAAGGTIGPALAPVAALAALALAGRRWPVALGFLGVLGGSLLVAALFYDVSWDGQAYHQEAVLALAQGWNPLREGHLPAARFDNLWINHYPKAAWLIEAALLRATGQLEAVKGLTLMLGAAAGLLSYTVLRARAPRWLALAAALVLAGHPVLLAQGWSFYVDGMLAALLTALLVLAVLPREPLVRAAEVAALVLVINLKFTGLVYAAVIVLAHTLLVARQWRWAVPALLAGTLVLGFDPYVRNTLERGHPFYPIAGPRPVDLLTPHQSPSLLRQPRPVRLALSIFARSSEGSRAPELKAPWSVRADELEAMSYEDTRIGGFGPLFAAALLAALLLLPALRPSRPVLVVGAAVLASTLINPGLWWARYVPQLWLVPAGLLALAAAAPAPGRWLRAGRVALLALLLANQGLVLGAQIDRHQDLSRAIDEQLVVLRRASVAGPLSVSFKSFDALAARLRAQGVPFQLGGTCSAPLRLVASPAEVCLAGTPPAGSATLATRPGP